VEAPLCLGPDPDTRPPRQPLPRGATDCHCHTFDDPARYPLIAHRAYTPHPAPLSEYLRMCGVLGIERCVQVNSGAYGFDNSITLDVIAQLGPHRARGVGGIRPDIEPAELERLHAGGIRGARLSTKVKGYGGTELVEQIAAKIAPHGWHVQLHFGHGGDEIAALEARLLALPVPIVFDHLGRVRGNEGTASPGFQALCRILKAREDCWVKISSFYKLSASGAPGYADMGLMARALVALRPDRVVWGSNWPHPNEFGPQPSPNDGDLMEVFCEWVPDAETRRRILVDNPAALYGFPALD
jgi:predicted TIM-barrel fold metal-dependent hydrolase